MTAGGARSIAAKGQLQATWRLESADAKLVLATTGITVESATLAGNKVEPAMAQAMLGQECWRPPKPVVGRRSR